MATDPLPTYLQEYLDGLVPPRPAEMQAMEAYAKETHFPIIGPSSGYFCYQVARMLGVPVEKRCMQRGHGERTVARSRPPRPVELHGGGSEAGQPPR